MHRPDDITYYEGLGVANNASPEEIRDAFRALVRLLHPDQQLDEQLRIIAERQMRKINRIYAVLSDAERRRRYDYSLLTPSAPTIVFSPKPKANIHRLTARFAWIGAVILTVLILVWLSWEGPTGGPFPVVDRVNAQRPLANSASSGPQPPDAAQLQSELNAMKAERDGAIHELTRLRASSAKKLETPSSFREGFAGIWVYTNTGQGHHNPSGTHSPPDFIEAAITQQGATIHGQFRSQYRTVDRATSADVNFEFTGNAEASSIVCPWLGPGGSRGELTLRLIDENTMDVKWTANNPGGMQGLVSGAARLMRRAE